MKQSYLELGLDMSFKYYSGQSEFYSMYPSRNNTNRSHSLLLQGLGGVSTMVTFDLSDDQVINSYLEPDQTIKHNLVDQES